MPTTVNKTVKSSGGDYTSVSAWEAGQQAVAADIVAADQIQQAECFAFQDTTNATLAGWTTDATRYLRVYAHAGAEAQMPYNTSTSYRLETTTGSSALAIQQGYTRIERIQVKVTAPGFAGGRNAVEFNYANGPVAYLLGCYVRFVANASDTVEAYGVEAGNANSIYVIANCVFDGFSDVGSVTNTAIWGQWGTGYVYNNTMVNCARGIASVSNGLIFAKNNLYYGAGIASPDGFFTSGSGAFDSSSDYNASTVASDASGAHSRNSQTFTFVNTGTGDYHLASGDGGAKNFGVDLSADSHYAFNTDFDAVSRPQGASWDIGATEYASVGNSPQIVGAGASGSMGLPANLGKVPKFFIRTNPPTNGFTVWRTK